MKEIIDGKLYDLDKSKKVSTNLNFFSEPYYEIWITDKQNWFMMREEIIPLTKKQAKKILGRIDTDAYEKNFGKVKE